jgi:hypothetical protein
MATLRTESRKTTTHDRHNATIAGASDAVLNNPVQRFARDLNTASNHRIFERDGRYADHTRHLLGQPIQSLLV